MHHVDKIIEFQDNIMLNNIMNKKVSLAIEDTDDDDSFSDKLISRRNSNEPLNAFLIYKESNNSNDSFFKSEKSGKKLKNLNINFNNVDFKDIAYKNNKMNQSMNESVNEIGSGSSNEDGNGMRKLRKSASLSQFSPTKSDNESTTTPIRRFSICDLDSQQKNPISPVGQDEERDYFTHHPRRNSVALKFHSPKIVH